MADPVQVSVSADGTTISLLLGQTLQLHLPEGRTTGFRWHLLNDGRPILNLSTDQFDANTTNIGAPGTHSWTFTAEQSGDAIIELGLGRSWQSSPKFSRSFSLRVEVRAA